MRDVAGAHSFSRSEPCVRGQWHEGDCADATGYTFGGATGGREARAAFRAWVESFAAWLTASRARAMTGRSAIVEAVEGMVVDERAWRWHEVDSMSFEPDGDPVDAFAYHDGSWSYEDPFGPDEASGQSTNIRTAMLAVQRAHAAHALSVCGSATSGGR